MKLNASAMSAGYLLHPKALSAGCLNDDGSVHLRPANSEDLAFLQQVYASTRQEELSLTNWSDAQKEAFITMQFQAQDRFYRSAYPGAEFSVILVAGQPAGRFYLHPREQEIRIMDITLLPPFRRKGIGTRLLEEVLRMGRVSARAVSIHVEQFNPARRLYERLGFVQSSDHGIYCMMEWRPPDGADHNKRLNTAS